jgi:hypothetical protein
MRNPPWTAGLQARISFEIKCDAGLKTRDPRSQSDRLHARANLGAP